MQGRLSAWLVKRGLIHRSLGFDYQGIETLLIKPEDWHSTIAVILYVYGYNYLRSQCAYDVAPGGACVSSYENRVWCGSTKGGMHKKYLLRGRILGFRLYFGFGKVWIFKNGNLMICWESLMIIIH
ncbi:LOW QUALITY PROTEIN: hypothetical protein RJ639_003647, partial [Escallonia herrerae]